MFFVVFKYYHDTFLLTYFVFLSLKNDALYPSKHSFTTIIKRNFSGIVAFDPFINLFVFVFKKM